MFICSNCQAAVDNDGHTCPSFSGWLRCQTCHQGVRIGEALAHSEACWRAVEPAPVPPRGPEHVAGSGRSVSYGRGYGPPPDALLQIAAARVQATEAGLRADVADVRASSEIRASQAEARAGIAEKAAESAERCADTRASAREEVSRAQSEAAARVGGAAGSCGKEGRV